MLVVFLPGLIWAAADRRWGFDKNPPLHMLAGKSLIFGLISYWVLVYSLRFYGLLRDMPILIENPILKLGKETRSATIEYEILGALPVTFFLIGVWLLAVNKDLLTSFWIWIRVVPEHKDKSMFSIALEHTPQTKQTIRVWDDNSDRTYLGKLVGYEESNNVIGVIISDVTISSISGNVISKSEQFLYSCKKEDFKIEIINLEETKNETNI